MHVLSPTARQNESCSTRTADCFPTEKGGGAKLGHTDHGGPQQQPDVCYCLCTAGASICFCAELTRGHTLARAAGVVCQLASPDEGPYPVGKHTSLPICGSGAARTDARDARGEEQKHCTAKASVTLWVVPDGGSGCSPRPEHLNPSGQTATRLRIREGGGVAQQVQGASGCLRVCALV